jgi:hypothetical protein
MLFVLQGALGVLKNFIRIFSLTIFLSFFTYAFAHATIPGSERQSGSWVIFGQHNPENSTNSCTAANQYVNGVLLLITTYPNGQLHIGLVVPVDAFPEREAFSMTLSSERGVIAPTLAVSRGVRSFVTDYIPPTTEAMSRLQRDNRLDVVTPFGTWSLSLRGSRMAISEALRCTAQYENYRPTTSAHQARSGRPFLEQEMELALQTILQIGRADIEFMQSEVETTTIDESWRGVSWISSDASYFGRVLIVDLENELRPLSAFQGGQIELARSICEGSVLNTARSLTQDGVDILENQVVCEINGDIDFYAYYHSLLSGRIYLEITSLFYADALRDNAQSEATAGIPVIAAQYSINNLR